MGAVIRPTHIENVYWENDADIAKVAQKLRLGGAVVGDSDTVPGLLAAVTERGFEALNRIKGRTDKPYLILVGAQEKVANFAETPLSKEIQRLIDCCWPGPLTLVLKARPDFLFGAADGTVALRLPDHAGLRSLLRDFDGLFSTSANKSNERVPTHVDMIDESILEQVAYCICDKKEGKIGPPSTIVDCTGQVLRVLREGAYSVEALKEIVGQDNLQ